MSKEVEKQKNFYIKILLIVALFLIVVGCLIFFFFIKNDDKKDLNNENENMSNVENKYKYSFQTLDATDDTLSDDQRELAKYFDSNFFSLDSYEEIVRYADTLKNIRVATYCQVYTILSTDEENYEAVCNWGNSIDYFWGYEEIQMVDSIIIKGKKPDGMFVKEDLLAIKGRLVGAEARTIEGKNKYLPVIEVTELGTNGDWFSEDTIRKVAKLVFGDNIKVRRPTSEETEKMVYDYFYSFQDSVFLVEFENQSNLNFKVFDMWQNLTYGTISYNAIYNQGIETDYLNKRLYVTPDLQKYIVFDYSRMDSYIYISVYNRNLEKLWSREISNVSNITWDATDTQLTFINDNDMYFIDIETGKDIIKPVFVGKKISVSMIENGYILLNESRDDAVMVLDKEGKIKNKFDINLNITQNSSIYTSVQKLDENYVILFTNYEFTDTYDVTSKYIIIDKDGNLIKETN